MFERCAARVLNRRKGMSRTVLFVHGMFLTGRSWQPWCDLFESRGITCSAPSWPGRDGDPGKLRAEPDPKLATLTLTDLVTQYEQAARLLDNPILVGHSMGGLIVQLLLAR